MRSDDPFFNFIASVTELCGADTADLIQREFVGCRLYVPTQAGPYTRLGRLIGADHLKVIVREWGGVALDLPIGDYSAATTAAAERRSLIRQLCVQGATDSEIARQARCSIRTVYQHRARLRREGILPSRKLKD